MAKIYSLFFREIKLELLNDIAIIYNIYITFATLIFKIASLILALIFKNYLFIKCW